MLKSPDAALSLSRTQTIPSAKPGKPHQVYAATHLVSLRVRDEPKPPVELGFAPLP